MRAAQDIFNLSASSAPLLFRGVQLFREAARLESKDRCEGCFRLGGTLWKFRLPVEDDCIFALLGGYIVQMISGITGKCIGGCTTVWCQLTLGFCRHLEIICRLCLTLSLSACYCLRHLGDYYGVLRSDHQPPVSAGSHTWSSLSVVSRSSTLGRLLPSASSERLSVLRAGLGRLKSCIAAINHIIYDTAARRRFALLSFKFTISFSREKSIPQERALVSLQQLLLHRQQTTAAVPRLHLVRGRDLGPDQPERQIWT